MSNIRIAVNMQPQRDGNGNEQFRAALPMGVLFEKTLDRAEMDRAAAELEQEYAALVGQLRAHRAAMGRKDVLAYWRFGDALVAFENLHKTTILFVDRLVDHLVRDVDFSETMILLCRRFREAISDAQQVDPQQSFTNYHRAGFDPTRLATTVRRRGRPRKSIS